MDTTQIIANLRAERDRLNAAIAALVSLDGTGARRDRAATITTPTGRRRRMSAEARARIAAAQRARWAKQKRRSKPPQKIAANKVRRGGITAAGRKRLSAMMKARWAAKKKQAKTA